MVKLPQKTTFAVLRDVHEPAGTGHPGAKFADIDIAVLIGLRHSEEGYVEPPAVVIIKHGGVVYSGLTVECRAKIITGAGRYPAEQAYLRGQRHFIADTFFSRDGGDSGGNAYSQVDNGIGGQLHGGAAGNDLFGIQGQGECSLQEP